MNESFGREEKLKSKVLIDRLFSEGKSLQKYPLRLIYLPKINSEAEMHKTAVSVPKRRFKKAVDRNKIKRLMREAFRKNKYLVSSNLDSSYALMFVYTGREKEEFPKIFSATEELLKRLVQQEKKNIS